MGAFIWLGPQNEVSIWGTHAQHPVRTGWAVEALSNQSRPFVTASSEGDLIILLFALLWATLGNSDSGQTQACEGISWAVSWRREPADGLMSCR